MTYTKKFRIVIKWNYTHNRPNWVIEKKGWFFWNDYENAGWHSYRDAYERLQQILDNPV